MSKGQASLEYLLVYGLALFILGAALSSLYINRPDVEPPDSCDAGSDFTCLEGLKRDSSFVFLLQPRTRYPVTVSNFTITYQDRKNQTEFCFAGPGSSGVPTSGFETKIGPNERVSVNCDLSQLTGIPDTTLDQKEEASVEFTYKEERMSFPQRGKIMVIN